LLNLPQHKEAFNNFITTTYKPVLTSQHGIMDYTNYKVYFTNTLESVKQIFEEITAVFVESGFSAVKMELRFNVIFDGLTVEAENNEIISSCIKALINSLLPPPFSSSCSSQIIKKLIRLTRKTSNLSYLINYKTSRTRIVIMVRVIIE
jgi:hypothetical protein